MHYSFLTGVILTTAAVTTAFQHNQGDADGLYVHGFDAAGKPTVQFLGVPGNLKQPAAPRDVLSASPIHPRDFVPRDIQARGGGPSGKDGPNCDANTKRDATQFATVKTSLGWGCDSITWWHKSISYVYQDVVAYACDYGNGNHCGTGSITAQWGGLDATCGPTVAGWYTDKKDLFAMGRTAAGHQFCFKNEVGGQPTDNSNAQGDLAAAQNQFASDPSASDLNAAAPASAPAAAAPAPAPSGP